MNQNIDIGAKMLYNSNMKKRQQPINIGDHVSYSVDDTCTGIVVEIGETLVKVKWFYHDVAEWMPPYSLELTNESP